MTTPRHHPDTEDLLAYAAGATAEWQSLVIACHLTFCPRCRDEVAWCDDLGGALLETLPGEQGRADRSLLPLPLPERARVEPMETSMPDPRLPRPVASYFKERAPKWRFLAPGVRHIPLSIDVNGRPVRVVEFRPGYVIPEHAHRAGETLVIFRGALEDSRDGATYEHGDICRSEAGSSHVQTICADEPCVSLVVNEGPLVPASPWGRLLQWLTGI